MTSERKKVILHTSETHQALVLFREGHYDTMKIASILGAEEFAVYNALHRIRNDIRVERS